MYFKRNDKGQYYTGDGWSFNRGRRRMYETFDEVCQTPKEGRIQMDRPPTKETADAVLELAKDAGILIKSFSIPNSTFNLQFGELQIRIHWNKNGDGFSVGTKLNHPVQGTNWLWRNYCTLEHVKRILLNPREHIGLPTQKVI